MPSPTLPEVEAAARDVADRLVRGTAGPEAVWQIEGVPAAGKSTCLGKIADILAQETDLVPVLVTPPGHHLDAGVSALADVAVALASRQILNGEVAGWKDQTGRWTDRVNSVRTWVTQHREKVVLLCDEPRLWGANRPGDDLFARRGFDAAFLLAALPCRRVISGELPVPIAPQATVRLSPTTRDVSWLAEYESWGRLEGAAREVVVDTDLLSSALTPLQMRLLIASVAVTSAAEVSEWFTGPREARRLVPTLARALRDRGYRHAWDAWLRLSFTRRPFSAELLGELMPGRSTPLERDIVRHCLVFGDQEFRLHDQLKLYASRWRTEHARRVSALSARTNRTLFTWHQTRFTEFATNDDPRAVLESIEAFHFASASGSTELIEEVRPLFVDQLDALGWSLSYEHRKYARAADAFEQAIAWDERDDYAHHYLAYNLDRIGRRIDDVERHYRRAVSLNGAHTWWRSRLIVFLLGRGRIGEAQIEWEDALLQLGVGDGDASADTYESLHCWVAGALLDVGETRWARGALDEIPSWARGQIDIYEGLAQRADALLELGEGPAVVPAWRLRPGWWESGPELLQHRLGTGEQLVRWLAGRVESKDEAGIRVRAAVLTVPQEDVPRFAWTELTYEQFDALCRDAVRGSDLAVGSFVEAGVYAMPDTEGSSATTLLRVLTPRRLSAAGLPFFHGDRYLTDLIRSR